MPRDIYLSVVIPTFNEEKRIEASLHKIKDFLEKQGYSFEIIISDDGSTDSTCAIVKEYEKKWNELKLLQNRHKGKAPALISGINESTGKYILFTDIDLSVSIQELPKFLVWLTENGYDLAISTREGTGAKRVDEPYVRHLMGRIFNLLVRIVVLPGINDTQCGFKAFRSSSIKKIFEHTLVYKSDNPEIDGGMVGAFDVEILFVAKRLNFKIKEVPVTWIYIHASKVHKLKDSYYNAKDVFKVRLNSLKGLYPPKKNK